MSDKPKIDWQDELISLAKKVVAALAAIAAAFAFLLLILLPAVWIIAVWQMATGPLLQLIRDDAVLILGFGFACAAFPLQSQIDDREFRAAGLLMFCGAMLGAIGFITLRTCLILHPIKELDRETIELSSFFGVFGQFLISLGIILWAIGCAGYIAFSVFRITRIPDKPIAK